MVGLHPTLRPSAHLAFCEGKIRFRCETARRPGTLPEALRDDEPVLCSLSQEAGEWGWEQKSKQDYLQGPLPTLSLPPGRWRGRDTGKPSVGLGKIPEKDFPKRKNGGVCQPR